jgi:hypothetical protein
MKILVDIFNFWLAQGNAPTDEEESVKRMKVISYQWLHFIISHSPFSPGPCGLDPKQLAPIFLKFGEQG